ncbi:hypothetical protein VQ056_14215 [Paenibacillus sp. JTLBN-2024]
MRKYMITFAAAVLIVAGGYWVLGKTMLRLPTAPWSKSRPRSRSNIRNHRRRRLSARMMMRTRRQRIPPNGKPGTR